MLKDLLVLLNGYWSRDRMKRKPMMKMKDRYDINKDFDDLESFKISERIYKIGTGKLKKKK